MPPESTSGRAGSTDTRHQDQYRPTRAPRNPLSGAVDFYQISVQCSVAGEEGITTRSECVVSLDNWSWFSARPADGDNGGRRQQLVLPLLELNSTNVDHYRIDGTQPHAGRTAVPHWPQALRGRVLDNWGACSVHHPVSSTKTLRCAGAEVKEDSWKGAHESRDCDCDYFRRSLL